jgi:hypothetical protein
MTPFTNGQEQSSSSSAQTSRDLKNVKAIDAVVQNEQCIIFLDIGFVILYL